MQRETRHSHVAAGPQVNCAQWGCGQPEGRRPSDGAAWLSYGRPWPPGNHPILTTARPSWGSCEPLIRQTPVLVKQLHSVRCGEPSGALPWAGAGSWATSLCPPPTGPLISKVLATSGDLVSGPLPIAGARCASGGLLGLKASVLTGVGVCFTLDALSQIIPIN